MASVQEHPPAHPRVSNRSVPVANNLQSPVGRVEHDCNFADAVALDGGLTHGLLEESVEPQHSRRARQPLRLALDIVEWMRQIPEASRRDAGARGVLSGVTSVGRIETDAVLDREAGLARRRLVTEGVVGAEGEELGGTTSC